MSQHFLQQNKQRISKYTAATPTISYTIVVKVVAPKIAVTKLNLKNPWHLFLDNFKKIMNSSLLTEETKHKNLAIELNWFYNTPRVEDWLITNTKRKK